MIKEVIAGLVIAGTLFAGPAGARTGGATIDQIIVDFRPAPKSAGHARRPAARVLRLPDGRVLRFLRRMGSGALVYALPEPVSVQDAKQILDGVRNEQDVLAAQLDRRVHPAYAPSDALTSFYNLQWNLHGPAVEPFGINAEDAWDVSRGDSASVVAVLDTGLVSHEDLNPARILAGYDFISQLAKANDGDGRDPDPFDPGDWVAADECGPGEAGEDSSWHGMLVTGIIAAEPENDLGIEGIDFFTRVLPVRVLGKCGGYVSDIVDAIRWVVGESRSVNGTDITLPEAQRARVINLSFSGDDPEGCSPQEQAAIDYARAAGAVVVTAAGNQSGQALDYSPGNCQGVINVAASMRTGELAPYSNFGENVDFVAPGGLVSAQPSGEDGVLTLSNGGTTSPTADDIYVFAQGTSFTAAQTSAVAGLILAVNPDLTPDQVGSILCATAQPLPACDSTICGNGLMDANSAVTLAQMSVGDPSVIPGDGSCPAKSVNVGDSLFANPAGGGGGCVALAAAGRVDPSLWIALPVLALLRRRRPARRAPPGCGPVPRR
jgi:serine protease